MRRLVASRDQVWRGSGRASVKCSRPLPRSSSSPSTQRIAQPCSRRCLDLAPRPRPPLRRPHRAHLASLNGPSSAQPGPRRPPQQPAAVRPARPLERSSFASAWIAARKEDGAGSVRLPPRPTTIEAASRPSASSANSPSSAHLPGAAQRTHRAVCDGAPPPLTLLARYIRPDPPCRPTPTSPGSLATSSSLSRSPSSSSVLPAPSPAARRAQTEEQQLPPRPQPRRQPCSTKRPVRRLLPLPRQSARHALTPGVRAGNEVVRQDFNMALGFAAALVLLVCAPAAASWFANRRYTSGWILRRGTSRASASHFSRTDEKGEKGEKGERGDIGPEGPQAPERDDDPAPPHTRMSSTPTVMQLYLHGSGQRGQTGSNVYSQGRLDQTKSGPIGSQLLFGGRTPDQRAPTKVVFARSGSSHPVTMGDLPSKSPEDGGEKISKVAGLKTLFESKSQ